MPNLPYALSTDRSDVHRRSGAELLIRLGRKLSELDAARRRRRHPRETWVPDDLQEEIGRIEEAIKGHFEARPRAKLKKYLLATLSGGRRTKGIDVRACRVVGFLASELVAGRTECKIMAVASATSLTGEPADVLEMRRVVARLILDGVLATCTMDAAELNAPTKLRTCVSDLLLGGDECLPRVDGMTLAMTEQHRRQRLSKAERCRQVARQGGVASFAAGLPRLTPRELEDELLERGYRGQERARRALCLTAARHVRRLRRIHVDRIPFPDDARPGHMLCKGPTGCGKTFLARLLFSDILGIPTAVLDMPSYTEAGFVGEDLGTIPTRLILEADGNIPVAQCGVLVMDEFDKLAETDGGRRHVSRFGCQRGVLKLLEPGSLRVPPDLSVHPWKAPRVEFRTDTMLAVALGAFSGWEQAVASRAPIGYGADGKGNRSTGAAAFERFGLLRELTGRFGQVVEFDPLSEDEMLAILERLVGARACDLARDGIRLEVSDEASAALVRRGVRRGTGARALGSELDDALVGAAFDAMSRTGERTVISVRADGQDIVCEVVQRKPRRDNKVTVEEIADLVDLPGGGEGACA